MPRQPTPEGIDLQEVQAGGARGEWVSVPGASSGMVMLFFHGGGYCLGDVADRRDFAARVSAATGGSVLNLDYRLAPEAPFPAAFDDAVSAYEWLLAAGHAPEQIVVGGDSAGGGLALAATMAVRDRGLPLPAAIVALSPWTDLTMSQASITGRAKTDTLGEPVLTMLAKAYAGPADRSDPRMSPLFGDSRGLPAMLIMVGTIEILYDDAAQFATRAIQAEVPVHFEPWPEVPHVWPTLPRSIPEAVAATDRIGAFINMYAAARVATAV
ncbi:MAG: alpha/beta hydrolase [Dehalococcoidia bacterium]|nr:alpha/beta hydrolase [Dehalococcoidia bacterium]MCB9484581.1 alpha/beta hydrolase [Thermoflexaceae bacterium]